jgi:hypothetical protein
MRAAGETETTQENIQDWLQLDEGDTGFQLLTEEKITADILLFIYFVKHNRSEMVAVLGPYEALPYYIHIYLY